jgi:hypothetical protein
MADEMKQGSLFDFETDGLRSSNTETSKQEKAENKKEQKRIEKEKKNIEKNWKPYDLAEYQDLVANGLVHFTYKATNSNAKAGGVRLGEDEKLSLPYVCLQTYRERIDLEYVKSSNQTLLKQILWCATLPPEIKKAIPEPKENIEQITQDYHKLSKTHLEIGTEYVSPRLRQILLPCEDAEGGYVCLTPMRSPTFCEAIKQKVFQTNKDTGENKNAKRLNLVHMGFGGANPQNAGRFTRSLQSPLLFSAPTEQKQTQYAFSLYYKGVSLHCPVDIMDEYRKWKLSLTQRHPDGIPDSMRNREREKSYIYKIVQRVLQRAANAKDVLQANHEILPKNGDGLLPPQSTELQKGLIEPHVRNYKWANLFAEQLAKNIKNFVYQDSEEKLEINSTKLSDIKNWIKEVI